MGRVEARSLFGAVDLDVETRRDGTLVVRSRAPLGETARSNGAWLDDNAARLPDRTFLAERSGDGWQHLSYATARRRARALATLLLDRGLGPGRALILLSENSIANQMLALAAQYVGIPIAPVSPGLSLLARDHSRLVGMARQAQAVLAYAEDDTRFAAALAALGLPYLTAKDVQAAYDGSDAGVDTQAAKVGPDTIAKFLFTSGSTSLPKAVVTTQRMLTANQKANQYIWPFCTRRPPVLVDWTPWSHVFGGNFCLNYVLANAGTLYIDEGKPVPHLIGKSIVNLREISPTQHLNVPQGWSLLLPVLEQDADLRHTFFRDLDLMFYAGASLPAAVGQRLAELSAQERGAPLPMVSSWGMTETAPLHTNTYFHDIGPGNVGVPVPGSEVKLVPHDGRYELRVRGANVTPGYWRDGTIDRSAFDEEGFMVTGDAVSMAKPDMIAAGLRFEGRLSENFKLQSGTWVPVGDLRPALLSACPLLQDAVIAAPDRPFIGVLGFPHVENCRRLMGDPNAGLPAICADARVRHRIAADLAAFNAGSGGSSRRIARILLEPTPADFDKGEITEKGYLNQRRTLTERASRIRMIYEDSPAQEVMVL